jgi:futalosine hydrolase
MASEHSFTTQRVLFVVAIAAEVRPFLERIGKWPVDTPAERWPIVRLSDRSALTTTGIGRASAAAATACAIASTTFDRVINIGVAGALPGSGLGPGEVIIADESVFYEEGIELPDGWRDVQNLGFPLGRNPWAQGNVIIADSTCVQAAAHSIGKPHRIGRIATIATCSGTDEAARLVVRRTRALAEAMEGAAVLSTSLAMGVPAVEIRVISNTCGDRPAQQWDFKKAAAHVSEIVENLAC